MDSDSEVGDASKPGPEPALDDAAFADDEEEGIGAGPSAAQPLKTTHELDDADATIAVPEVDEVPADEVLERMGQILSVLKRSVIVKGVPSTDVKRANEHALDSDTLLVFEDRKVLGYVCRSVRMHGNVKLTCTQIHETFGPTYDPLYVVKFRSSHPPLTDPPAPAPSASEATPTLADDTPVSTSQMPAASPEPVPSPYTVARPVFHMPNRSRFVFVSELKRLKGSDASNAHDEEPIGNDPMDFSDDEEEQRYKRSLKADRQTGDKRK